MRTSPDIAPHPPILRVGVVHDDPRRPSGFWLEGWQFDVTKLTGTAPWDVSELREISARLGPGRILSSSSV